MIGLAKMLIYVGIGIIALGLLIWLGSKLGISFGKLPGDIQIQKEKVSFYFPITTAIIVSVILTLLLNLISWLKK